MLHTSISAYANRNRILARLVASFPLLFTTSGDVFCSKFSGVWEMLWIFKVVRRTRDRCAKINNSPVVSTGIEASSLEIWTANVAQSLTVGNPNKLMEFHLWRFKLEILQSWLPRNFEQKTSPEVVNNSGNEATKKNRHSDANISDFFSSSFFMLLFF